MQNKGSLSLAKETMNNVYLLQARTVRHTYGVTPRRCHSSTRSAWIYRRVAYCYHWSITNPSSVRGSFLFSHRRDKQ